MTDEKRQLDYCFLEPFRRYVPLAAWAIIILLLFIIPSRIISYGYLPPDDALRHAAYPMSGKTWPEIVVLNPLYQIDHEFGWNVLLGKIYTWTHCSADDLVIFSVVSLFILSCAAAVVWLKRPEAWLAALAVTMLAAEHPMRFMSGRPFLATVSVLFVLLLLWHRHGASPPRAWMWALMTALFAAGTFIHGAWYLWVLLPAAYFFAGQFRWCFALAACWAAGVLLGASLTGHPLAYPVQEVKLALLAIGAHETMHTLAGEFRPFSGDFPALVVLFALMILRRVEKLEVVPLVRNPAFWLVCISWMLGFRVSRFWDDFGWPALMVLVATDLQSLLLARLAADSFRRLALVGVLAAAAFFCVASDVNGRWSSSLATRYLSQDDPALKGWLPDKGGIFYSADMSLFYQTFFKNPRADWRYAPGFEPAWMPAEDFKIYKNIVWNFGDPKAYAPWVEKMTSADRLVIRAAGGAPDIPQLEWDRAVGDIWIGRLPRAGTNGAAIK